MATLEKLKIMLEEMTGAIKCDRCGYSSVNVTEFRRINVMYDPSRIPIKIIDHFNVCKKCYDELFDFRNSNEGGEYEED